MAMILIKMVAKNPRLPSIKHTLSVIKTVEERGRLSLPLLRLSEEVNDSSGASSESLESSSSSG
jgi:hypothetical protein